MSSDNDRDAQTGRFLPGNPGGPGRPRRAIESDYLAALSDGVPTDAWRAIVAKAVEQAQAGDATARAWLGSYVLGKPTGNLLVELAASELSGYDPIESKVNGLEHSKMVDGLFRALRRTE
jgi:hypothetical protein